MTYIDCRTCANYVKCHPREIAIGWTPDQLAEHYPILIFPPHGCKEFTPQIVIVGPFLEAIAL